MVARASLFLECARFVHRCNRGNWPEWMKGHHVNITKRGLSRGRSPVVGNKRNQKLQWNAAKYFCQWADVSQPVVTAHPFHAAPWWSAHSSQGCQAWSCDQHLTSWGVIRFLFNTELAFLSKYVLFLCIYLPTIIQYRL